MSQFITKIKFGNRILIYDQEKSGGKIYLVHLIYKQLVQNYYYYLRIDRQTFHSPTCQDYE